jgi:hypothetical protein
MNHVFSTLAIIIFFCSQLFAQDSISVSDFRYPETRAIDLKAGATGSYQHTSNDYDRYRRSNSTMNRSGDANSVNIRLPVSFLFFHALDNEDYSLNARADYANAYTNSSSEVTDTNGYSSSSDNSSYSSLYASVASAISHYFRDDGFHLAASLNLSEDLSNSSYSDYSENRRRTTFSGYAGLGYGRMREGTFVVYALRIVEKLQEDGVLKAALTHDQWMHLIDTIAHRREYTVNFERSEKYLMSDIVNELVKDSVLAKDLLTPYSIYRMSEAMRRGVNMRLFGWRIAYLFGPAGYERRNDYQQTNSYQSHEYDKDVEFYHTLTASWGYPFTLNLHANINGSVNVPTRSNDRRLSYSLQGSLLYEVGERLDILGSYIVSRGTYYDDMQYDPDTYETEIGNYLNIGLTYYLEDQLTFNASMIGYINNYNHYFSPNRGSDFLDRYNYSTFTFEIGLNYNIL